MNDNGFLEYIKGDVEKPVKYNAENLGQWNKYVTKAMRIILEGVRDLLEGVQDHIVTNIHGKEINYAMW